MKRILGLIVVFALLLAGCAPVQQETRVIRYAIAGAWDSLMPYGSISGSNYSRLIYDKIYDRLCFIHADGSLSPRGADAWESIEDGYAIRFSLNPDGIFHDRVIVTAEHWAETLRIVTNPACNIFGRSNFSILLGTDDAGCAVAGEELGVETQGDYVLTLRFKQPVSPEEFLLTYGREIYVLPTHLLEDIPPQELMEHELWRHPVGSGPCRFQSEVVGSSITLNAFSGHRWGRMGFDTLEIRVLDKSNHLSTLLSGDIDYFAMGNTVTGDNISFAQSQGLTVVKSDTYSSFYELMLNNQLLSSPDMRKAISAAIDQERLIAYNAGDLGEPAQSYLVPGGAYTPTFSEVLEPSANSELAKTYLELSDYHGETLILATTSARTGLAALIQQDLQAVGIQVELVTLDSAALFAGMTAGDYHMAIASHSVGFTPLWFVETRLTVDGGIFHITDQTYASLMQDVREAQTGRGDVQESVNALIDYCKEEMPFVPLFFTKNAYVESETVSGIEYTASHYSNENVWDWIKE